MNVEEILAELVAIDSTSSRSNVEIVTHLAGRAEGLGLCARLFPYTDERGVKTLQLVAVHPKTFEDGGEVELALVGHTDTVPFDPAWAEALTLTEREGRLYGRGACETKGFIAAALAALEEVGVERLTRPLALVLTADEEVGCLGAKHLAEARPFTARHAVVGEPTSLQPMRAGKGYCLAEMTVRGREGHSAYPHLGASAIMRAARLVTRIEKVAEELKELGHEAFAPPQTTVNVGLISGGTAKNIIAGECRFTLEWRPVPGQRPGRVVELVEREVESLRAEDEGLSHGFWQRHLGGVDTSHMTLPLSGQTYTVVGVLPASFTSPYGAPDVWIPLRVGNPVAADVRGVHFLRTFFRLKEGVTPAQAQAEMDIIAGRLAEAYPEENKGRMIRLMSLHEYTVGDARPALLITFGAVGLVLLIACANSANLLLARAAARKREVAVRAALGAGRLRIVRQMLTESVLLSHAGGACVLVLALWVVDVLRTAGPESLPRLQGVGVDWRVLSFTLGVSVLTGLVFGAAPPWSGSRVDLQEALKEGGRGSSGASTGGRLRGALVASELALALVLLIGAGLLVKSFWLLRSGEPG